MNWEKLRVLYLSKLANTQHAPLQQQASGLNDQLMQMQQDENVVDADIQKEQAPMGQQTMEIEDLLLQNAMPEIQGPDDDEGTFGKVSCWNALKKKASKDNPVTVFTQLKKNYGTNNHRRKNTA